MIFFLKMISPHSKKKIYGKKLWAVGRAVLLYRLGALVLGAGGAPDGIAAARARHPRHARCVGGGGGVQEPGGGGHAAGEGARAIPVGIFEPPLHGLSYLKKSSR